MTHRKSVVFLVGANKDAVKEFMLESFIPFISVTTKL
jgi:hypothetical protein